jgi:PGF-CTERM protein
MRMYAPNQSQIGSSISFSGTEALAVASEQGGTYSVEVYGFGGESGPYSLSLTTGEDIETNLNPGFGSDPTPGTGPSLEPDQFEPNDNFGAATEIAASEYTDLTIQDGENDYFAVEMSQGQTLTAEIGFNNSQGDLDMGAYGPGETERDDSVSAFSDSESVSLTANQSGTHYVEVYGFVGESAEYSLNLSGTGVPSGDDNPDSSDSDNGTDGNDGNSGESSDDAESGDSSGPGFGLLAALLGLGGAGYLVRRRD